MSKQIDFNLVLQALKDWGKVLLILLDEAIVIVVVLLVLHLLGVKIPLPVMIVGGILIFFFVFIVHVAVIPSFHVRKVTGKEGMIGTQGKVVEPLIPVGTINIRGEYWRAKSTEDNIESGEIVEIIELEGLTLKVKHKK